MSKFILKVLGLLVLLSGIYSTVNAVELGAEEADRVSIEQLVADFGAGVDTQNGGLLSRSFHADGIIYGFAGDGASIITLDVNQFASLHEQKRFGGQQRDLSVHDLSVTDGLLASASVDAVNEAVFYNYRMTFIKIDSVWQILTVTQRSRSN